MTADTQPQLAVYDIADLPQHMQDRIWVDDDGCWIWQTGCDRFGYGRCSLSFPWTDRRRWSSHRLAYQLLVGPIAEGMHIDHLCRVRPCCNPAHLEQVTPKENVNRSSAADYWLAKSECPRGHAYDIKNTGRSTKGGRICRRCARDKMRVRRAAKRQLPIGGFSPTVAEAISAQMLAGLLGTAFGGTSERQS